jgi:hypothetical protein
MSEGILGHRSPQKTPVEYFQIALDAVKEVTGIEITPDQEARLLIEAGKMSELAGELPTCSGYVRKR